MLQTTDLLSEKFQVISPFLRIQEDKKCLLDLTDAERKKWSDWKTFYSRPRVTLEIPCDPCVLYSWKAHKRYQSLRARGLAAHMQKGELWHARRKKVITGSRIGNILNFWGLEGYIDTFYNIYMDEPNPDKIQEEEISRACFEEKVGWGNQNEHHAATTWMSLFGEAFDLEAEESKLTDIVWEQELWDLIKYLAVHKFKRAWTEEEQGLWKNFMRDSPDLNGRFRKTLKAWVLELKCKYGTRAPAVFDAIPAYYISQLQAHCLAMQTEGCYFLSWSPTITKIWYLPKDLEFWRLSMEHLMHFHLMGIVQPPVPPTALYEEEASKKIRKHCELLSKNAKIICCTRSIFSKEDPDDWDSIDSGDEKTSPGNFGTQTPRRKKRKFGEAPIGTTPPTVGQKPQ